MTTQEYNWLAPGRIDSWLKLQLLSVFERHTSLCRDARGLSEWLGANPWALEQTLDELAAMELLERVEAQGLQQYRRAAGDSWHQTLHDLLRHYSDPNHRDQIVALVHAAERERQFLELRAAIEIGGEHAHISRRPSVRDTRTDARFSA